MLQRFFICLLCIVFSTSLSAISISGKVVNRKNAPLSIYYISNFITNEKVVVDSCVVGEDDSYRFDFVSEQTRTYYIDLGTTHVCVVLEPDQDMVVDMPAYVALAKRELLNPYFEVERLILYDEKVFDINFFVTQIEVESTLWLSRVLNSGDPSHTALVAMDSLKRLEDQFDKPYLIDYAHYSSSFFYQMAHPNKVNAIKREYLYGAEPDLQNIAFTQIFSNEYENAFVTADGFFIDLAHEVFVSGEISDDFVAQVAKSFRITSPAMAELLCVKSFYDIAAYAPVYTSNCVMLMKQLEQYLQHEGMAQLCHFTWQKMSVLMEGYPAPYYELYTLEGKKVPLVLKRRNVLLAFINTNIADCQRHLRLLETVKTRYKRDIEVVCVAVYQSREELERFLNRNMYDNIFITLWDDNQDLLDDYNVKALPTYCLIGKDGNLIFSSLPSPEEDMMEILSITLDE